MKRLLALMLTALALAAGVADAQRRSGGSFGGSRGSGGFRAPRSLPPAHTSTRTPSSVQQSAANRAAVRVTPAQRAAWNNVKLPAGVPRRALTYSTTRSAQYPYELAPGRYFPYPQSDYRSWGIGSDLLKYALVLTAVSSAADALDGPDVVGHPVPTPGDASSKQEPNLWTFAGVGFLAAAAAWCWVGRRR
ncbi:hypothetical protein [Deinococcus sp. YIM 77859]|uniref:hypothetical protein n=1 Tax=Deinococcus sp. YIM 77859 TaxID=1540221 RepID=UPI00054DAD9B|nr:hypothetical protein [Deinococcus sp. YIM 77859]